MHGALAVGPALLLTAAAVFEIVAFRRRSEVAGRWARGLLAAGLAAVLLTAFTGLDARKALPSEGTEALVGVDRHVLVAIVLLFPLVGAGVVRLRIGGARAKRSPWTAPALTAFTAILAWAILWMGATSR